MNLLQDLITSGHIVDLMLGFVALEVTAIAIYRKRTGGGLAMVPLLINIGAGGSLMLALRMALADAGWTWIAPFLISALVFHIADLRQRWSPS